MSFHDVIQPLKGGMPDVNLMDVTLRDGGFAADFMWSLDVMRCVVSCLAQSKVHAIEVGYIGGLPDGAQGNEHTRLTPQTVADLKSYAGNTSVAAMIHPMTKMPDNIADFRFAGLDILRLTFFSDKYQDLPEIKRLIKEAKACGLSVFLNLVMISRQSNQNLIELRDIARDISPDVLTIVDTCGSLFPNEVLHLLDFFKCLKVPLALHAHNYLHNALENSRCAAIDGCQWIDGSLMGLGRGAGNLSTELWQILYNARNDSDKFDIAALEPALAVIKPYVERHDSTVLSGYISGALNLTPAQEARIKPCLGTFGAIHEASRYVE